MAVTDGKVLTPEGLIAACEKIQDAMKPTPDWIRWIRDAKIVRVRAYSYIPDDELYVLSLGMMSAAFHVRDTPEDVLVLCNKERAAEVQETVDILRARLPPWS